jgi:ectoine hydroxylase-related dioxygenase (phytanoyl-CoA dioxygenase family)
MCKAGDVTIVNRQALHGSFANTSPDLRVSLTFGFHRRASVLGQTGALSQTDNETYDEQRIFDRSAVIPIAIDARANHYKDESRFEYQPFLKIIEKFQDTEANRAKYLMDYNLKDLSI